jgi:rare lipoprotein A
MKWNAKPIATAMALVGCGAGAAASVPAAPYQTAPGHADPTAPDAKPQGSSQPMPGERRHDEVGYGGLRAVDGGGARNDAIAAVHPSLPANSYVEVTALDSGRTVLVLVTGTAPTPGHVIDLSPGAMQRLGAGDAPTIPVRVRAVQPTLQDQAALRAGRAAEPRIDAPPALLRALRNKLPPETAASAAAMPEPAPAPAAVAAARRAPNRPIAAPKAAPASQGRYLVQVAALSSANRAQALAQAMQGFVKAGGGLYRVQLGPFATTGEAQAARAKAVRAGYGDARILPVR